MKFVSRRGAAPVTDIGSDIDHQLEQLFLVFGSGKQVVGNIVLDYEQLKRMEDHLRRVRQKFDHARNIRAERRKRYVATSSISTVE